MAALSARLEAFLRGDGGDLTELALAAFAADAAGNPLLAALGGPTAPRTLEALPAVPVALFKELDLGPQPRRPSDVVFRTSGTTGQVRGERRMRDTRLYDLGAATHAERCIPGRPRRIFSLCPADADSSLGHMVASFGEVHGAFGPDGVAPDAWARLAALAAGGPVFLASTAFALDALFALPGAVALDERSVLMVTGGFKGRHTRLDAPGLYAAVPGRLGAPRVVGEYGMTELSSQLWTEPVAAGQVPGAFVAPPWLYVYPVDPASGAPVAGDGVLRFVDLANAGSVLAIETQDLGRVERRPEGDRVTLLGRLDGAELRGCSLRAEAVRARSGG